MSALRILLADDHDLMRRGIRHFLESHAGWEICGEVKTSQEAVALTKELVPDIVILSIGMSNLNGVEAAREIKKESNSTEVLILSTHYSDELIRELVGVGVRGYMLKSDPENDLLIALETLAKHEPFFTQQAREVVLQDDPVTQIPMAFTGAADFTRTRNS